MNTYFGHAVEQYDLLELSCRMGIALLFAATEQRRSMHGFLFFVGWVLNVPATC